MKGSPISPTEESRTFKRNRITAEDKLSHNKVIEALKAKIQRGNSLSALNATPIRHPHPNKRNKHNSRLPKVETSPRSTKPVLPMIDTSLGRIDKESKEEEDDDCSSSSSNSSGSKHSNNSSNNSSHPQSSNESVDSI